MNTIDQLIQKRANLMIYAALAFSLWQFSWIGKDYFNTSDNLYKTIFDVSYLLGSIAWALWTFWFWKLGNQIKKTAQPSAFNDELTLQNRLKAWKTGYFVLVGGITLLIPAVVNFHLEPVYGLRSVATLGIITPFIVFARAEKKNDAGAE